jgi:hypothetical protein
MKINRTLTTKDKLLYLLEIYENEDADMNDNSDLKKWFEVRNKIMAIRKQLREFKNPPTKES